MENDIVDGITKAIYDEYGEECKIYTESIEQGFKEPCFFVAVLDTEQARIIGNRHQYNIPIDVHYFPGTKAKSEEMREVKQALYSILGRITLLNGDMLNGFQMHAETVQDVLHFFVTYKPIVKYQQDAEETMAAVDVGAKVR